LILAGPVGIVGGGIMGSGIAAQSMASGLPVILVEASDQRAEDARERVRRAVSRIHEHDDGGARGRSGFPEPELLVSTDLAQVSGCPLVIESVPEVAELKREVLAGIAGIVAADTLIATNTSSIALKELQVAVGRPERFGGLHFFNPVPASSLVEVVRGSATGSETILDFVRFAEGLGKECIVVNDSPGFATSRLGVILGLEAIRMLEEGVASVEDIDRGMILGYRYPMGPLRLTDLVGLDVRLAIARYLAPTLGPRFEPPRLLVDKVACGELGKKSGVGFYTW
jgi:3-hydroxybutyryl-CoA dehydrogenase